MLKIIRKWEKIPHGRQEKIVRRQVFGCRRRRRHAGGAFSDYPGLYDDGIGVSQPGLSELMPKRPTVAALLGFAGGAVMLALGACFGRGALTLTGAVLGMVAWVFYVAAMAVMYRR